MQLGPRPNGEAQVKPAKAPAAKTPATEQRPETADNEDPEFTSLFGGEGIKAEDMPF